MSGQSSKRSANQLSQETGIAKSLLTQLTGSPGPYDETQVGVIKAFYQELRGRKATPALVREFQAKQYTQSVGEEFSFAASAATEGEMPVTIGAEEAQIIRQMGEEKGAVIRAGIDLVAATALSRGEFTTPKAQAIVAGGRNALLTAIAGYSAPYQIDRFLQQSGHPAFARLTPSQEVVSGSLPPSANGDGNP